MQNLQKTLIEILKNESTYFSEDRLLKNKLTEDAFKLEPRLIKYVLSNNRLKKAFFLDIDGVLVFDKDKFIQFVNNKRFLPDSYTSFKNRIGLLNENGDYFKEKKDVVLAWPYKDCVLEGGQDKEDEKRNEIFYNEILSPDEIDRLFDPKVLTNFKRYDKDGEHPNPDISKNDNLIIKGNNLLALHSLKKLYRGKVKLIYIDPPYNTGNDEFKYNDKFNHSTWLTFMKNRLEVARDLLRNDGVIFIQIDDTEISYLRILLDEIFKQENSLFMVTVERSAATGHKAINPTPVNVSDYIIAFAKQKNMWKYKPQYTKRNYDNAYNLYIENFENSYLEWIFKPLGQILSEKKFTIEEAIKIFPERISRFAEPSYTGVGKETRELIDLSKKEPDKVFCQKRENHPDIFLKKGQRILFYINKLKEVNGEIVTADALTTIWKDIPFQGIANEGKVVLKKGKKPEKLIKRIIELATEKTDLVLDYFVGTGTTCAVAHKMGRRYIGIEQLDYGENDSVVRLKNVINGDRTGISKSVNWKGEGSFVYAELKKWNQAYIEEIEMAKTTKNLLAIYEKMKKEVFFCYDVDLSKFDEKEFERIELEQQKEVLIECLDKNHLYVNLSEMDDATYEISVEDKEMNHKFYGL